MALLISSPAVAGAAGSPAKRVEEMIGKVNSQTTRVSITRMLSPAGWSESGQVPEFDEYSVVLRGTLRVRLKDDQVDVTVGQAIIVQAGEWVQYSTPLPGGADYLAVRLPASLPEAVSHATKQPSGK